jgi:hypothetical protein
MARLGQYAMSAFDWRANVGEDVRYRGRATLGAGRFMTQSGG